MVKIYFQLFIVLISLITLSTSCDDKDNIELSLQESNPTVSSKKRTIEQAMEEAERFMDINNSNSRSSKKLKDIKYASVVSTSSRMSRTSVDTLIYAFDFEDNEGFILVAAPKSVPAIIAITESGSFRSKETQENKSFQFALRAAEDFTASAITPTSTIEPIDKRVFESRDSIIYNVKTTPKVEVAWDQHWPAGIYFENHISGCVPLAISQILTAFELPKSLTYTFPGKDIDREVLNWADIKKHHHSTLRIYSPSFLFDNHYNSCLCSKEGHKTIGRLVRQVARHAGINPSPTDSTTGGTYYQALSCFIDLVGSTLKLTEGSGIENLYDALSQDAVCYIRGTNVINNIVTETGHAWVADGRWKIIRRFYEYVGTPIPTKIGKPQQYEYELVNQYDATYVYHHFNWGWGGNCNGWFSQSIFNPSQAKEYDNPNLNNNTDLNLKSSIKYIQVKNK